MFPRCDEIVTVVILIGVRDKRAEVERVSVASIVKHCLPPQRGVCIDPEHRDGNETGHEETRRGSER